MGLEVQIIPVSDVDRSKGFYELAGLTDFELIRGCRW